METAKTLKYGNSSKTNFIYSIENVRGMVF
jgi:hypothetical protein